MDVRLKVGFSGPAGSWLAGETYSCSAQEGARLIEAGFAEAIEVAPVEQAVKPKARARRAGAASK